MLGAVGAQTANENEELSFTATATGGTAPLTYSLDAGAPAGAVINGSTGAFTWTPPSGSGPATVQITIRVSDDESPARTDFETITVTVNDTTAPQINAVLANDTAPNSQANTDGVTFDPTVTGTITDRSAIAKLEGRINSGEYAEIPFDAENSTFTLTETTLNSLAGEPVVDGRHTVQLRTEDAAGNNATTSVIFDLDRQSPTVTALPTGTIRETFSELEVRWDEEVTDSAFNASSYSVSVAGGPSDGRVIAVTAVEQIDPSTVLLQFEEQLPDQDYQINVDVLPDDIAGNSATGPIQSSFVIADPTGLAEVSPANGEAAVNVTREAIIRFDEVIDPTTVPDSFSS